MRALDMLLDLLFPPSVRMERVRAIDEDALLKVVAPVTKNDITSLLPYQGVVKDVITRAKFHTDARAQRLLARALESFLAAYIAEETAFRPRSIVLIPVPLSRKRYRERGYNQVEEILKRANLPYATIRADLLKRTRDTKAQTTLGRRARVANMEDAFRASPLDSSILYIGIDDVATTGATLQAARAALMQAGAEEVRLIALAAPLERGR